MIALKMKIILSHSKINAIISAQMEPIYLMKKKRYAQLNVQRNYPMKKTMNVLKNVPQANS